jgi:hypothetical protein
MMATVYILSSMIGIVGLVVLSIHCYVPLL